MQQPKSLEEHCHYIEQFSRLSLFAAKKHFAEKKPELSLGDVLKNHTPLLSHCLNYTAAMWESNEVCLRVLARADALAHLSPEEFEEEMWRFIAPDALERAKAAYPEVVGVKAPPHWNCGSLRYDPPRTDRPEGWITFHIANAVGPSSIFADREYFALCFMLLMKETQIRYNGSELTTGTWLNEHKTFLSYFPQEYHDNIAPRTEEKPVPMWHFGWWGQVISGRGTINPKTEAFVRKNGYLPRACRSSHCSFESMRKHLKEHFL